MARAALMLLVLVGLTRGQPAAPARKPIPSLPADRQRELTQYLKQHWMRPEEYVVSKFTDHDIVFLGEYHRIKHDVQLVHSLIPRLYEAGVHNLGIEFGAYEYQDRADRLTTAETYDEDLARGLMFEFAPYWGFKEYMDIYRAAWELNRRLPPGAPRFRVVNLGYKARFDLVTENMTTEDWQRVWHKGDPDQHMADVIVREFVERGEKALIYSGSHHAFTRYRQPLYSFEEKKLARLNDSRMGNLVRARMPDRVFNIFLHSPWATKEGFESHSYPAGGAIDRVMLGFKDTRVGFDVRGTPFGQLQDEGTYYALGYEGFKLEDFCDGYIYQRHFADYEGCSVDPAFITEGNFQEAVAWLPNAEARKKLKRPSELVEAMVGDADMKRRFRDLQ